MMTFVKTLSVAHSPDADDIFMYFAIKFGWVGAEDLSFENSALDIETLNTEALKGTYDITAISFALYPKIRNDYALLRTAVSFGEGYGPKLVKKKETIVQKLPDGLLTSFLLCLRQDFFQRSHSTEQNHPDIARTDACQFGNFLIAHIRPVFELDDPPIPFLQLIHCQ